VCDALERLSSDQETTSATRRSYLMNELKNNYCDLDYAKLLINADEYSQIKAAVVGANGKKKKLKVT
jgi:hypothetical protein